jgi:hypothetical protein
LSAAKPITFENASVGFAPLNPRYSKLLSPKVVEKLGYVMGIVRERA